MKPINKLTVDLLTEKYVNNGTLESKFKELFDRITVIHGDMFAESMIMELECGTNWNDGNNVNIKRVDQKTTDIVTDTEEVSVSNYVNILNLPKLLLFGVKPKRDDFFNNDLEACRKKLTLTKIAKDFGNTINSNVLVKDIRNHVNVLWFTLKHRIADISDIKKQDACLDLIYPFKQELIEKSQSGKISVKEFDYICAQFEAEYKQMIESIDALGFYTHVKK